MKDVKKIIDKNNTYMAVAPQIVGNLSDWGYAYNFTDTKHKSPQDAESEGLEYFGHDDFFIGVFSGDKCVAVIVDGEKHTKDSDDFGEYVIGVNKELGI
jgi:hypothetical protein